MYKIVGADQKEYGPIPEEQLRQWIAEGRANGQTIVRFGDGPWKPLGTFPEFAAALGAAAPAISPTAPVSPPPPLTLGGPSPGAPPATNGLAIGGLVCGILGLFCCGPLVSTVGLILSVVALVQINQNPARYTGKGMAVAGIVLAIAGYIIFVLLLLSGALDHFLRTFSNRF